MLSLIKQVVRFKPTTKCILVRSDHGYSGGVPGCNLPFRIDNPYRFTATFLIYGVLGFGSPWLIVMHQMLRPYDYDDGNEESDEKNEDTDK